MALTIHDPGRVTLRRAIRAAVAFPIAVALALYVFDDSAGVLFVIFGTIGLLIQADFAGSTLERLTSYMATGVVGAVAIVIGWLASASPVSAIIVTVIVVFCLAFTNLLRGRIAVGVSAVQFIFVVAVALPYNATALPAYLEGWLIAVVVSTITALALMPRLAHDPIRSALADAFAALADAAEGAWGPDGAGPTDRTEELASAVDRLNRIYATTQTRLSSLSTRAQALTLLVASVNSARMILAQPLQHPALDVAVPSAARRELATCIGHGLRDISRAMKEPAFVPSAERLDQARVALLDELQMWVTDQYAGGCSPDEVSTRIGADHQLRMAALITEQTVEIARTANGAPVEDLPRRPPVPVLPRRSIIASQFHLRAPWLRNALRSAVGLGIAVLVVNLTGVERGFWVLLGVVAILRFDAMGTRQLAWQAVVGTLGGVAAAFALLAVLGDQPWLLWCLLPLTMFLAAWLGPVINFGLGQAAFSALIIFVLGIVDWPPTLRTGIVRVEDIALGAAVALVTGLLMWPRGAVGQLRNELAAATRASVDFLCAAISTCTGRITEQQLQERRTPGLNATERAAETLEVALLQRGPVENVEAWTPSVIAAYILMATGRVIADMGETTPQLPTHASLVEALDQADAEARARWLAVASHLQGSQPLPPLDDRSAPSDYPTLTHVSSPADARSLIVAVWIVDWVWHLDRMQTTPDASTGALA